MEWQIGGLYQVRLHATYSVYCWDGNGFVWKEDFEAGAMFLCLGYQTTNLLRILIAGMVGEYYFRVPDVWNGIAPVKCSDEEK
jgi:hypothetical protein